MFDDRLEHHWIRPDAGQLLQLVTSRTQVIFDFLVPVSMVGMRVLLFPFCSIFNYGY